MTFYWHNVMYAEFMNVALSGKERSILLRRHACHLKYEKAVEMYADTDLPMKEIARLCNVTVEGLGSYLRRYWRGLVLRRHHIDVPEEQEDKVKIIAPDKQSFNAHIKYKESVEACGSLDYIKLNLSQIARQFGVGSSALARFMRLHYPGILQWRERVRKWMGVNDNFQRGVRLSCKKQYAEAVELYRTTDMTIPEIAELCHVSESGFSQHLRFYHKGILRTKRHQRKQAAKAEKVPGCLTGNGRIYKPFQKTDERYAQALALYRDTAMTMKEIVQQTGVPGEGFRFYLHKWHRDLVLERLGITNDADGKTDLRSARKRMRTVAAKYEKAIESLRQNPRPISKVAVEFGLHPEVFRSYLYKHEQQLMDRQGIIQAGNGKRVLRQSNQKYAEAIRLYETTTESLKSIAARLGLIYNSVGGYVRRNYPEAIARHQALLDEAENKQH